MMSMVKIDRLMFLALLPQIKQFHTFSILAYIQIILLHHSSLLVLHKLTSVENRIKFSEFSRSFVREMWSSGSGDVLCSHTFTTSVSCALLLKPSVSPSLTTPPHTSSCSRAVIILICSSHFDRMIFNHICFDTVVMVTTHVKPILSSALLLQTSGSVLMLALSRAASEFCSKMSGVTVLAK